MNVNTEQAIPIKMWLDDIDANAAAQARRLANLPFAFSHVAIMPDAHLGYGMPIGGVLATNGVVVPNAVGVDIGCGMCAVQTELMYDGDVDKLKNTLGLIRRYVPVGFKHHSKSQEGMPQLPGEESCYIVQREWSKAAKSLGTLGGGNHFIELQTDLEGYLWVMIHSGSRNLGLQVAKYYNDIAKALNQRWHSCIPAGYDLAFLPLESHQAQSYIAEMNYCVDYALANRTKMMGVVLNCLLSGFDLSFSYGAIINIAHNYARLENHFGKNVMVHRKGATSAKKGEIGIIPGSQGTASYTVRGLGNPQSFMSCSHGAGRVMGRKQATRELDLDEQMAILDDQGIVHGIRSAKDLDEAPGAYKDIETVMENQRDLVEIVTKLKPIAVVKG
jgi:tRNA-splicing ligase RtcB